MFLRDTTAFSGCHSPPSPPSSFVPSMNHCRITPPSPYLVSPALPNTSYASSVLTPLNPPLGPESQAHVSPHPITPENPPPPQSKRPTRRNRGPNHIRRPRNPFMIYRTEFYRTKKSSLNFEKDHRHISRIIAFCWNSLSPAEKKPWYDKATAEKAEHAKLYPNYQYTPLGRTEPVRRRKVKRNGKSDIERCQKVARLLGQGKEGKDIVDAIGQYEDRAEHDAPFDSQEATVDAFAVRELTHSSRSQKSKPVIFRSPLLPICSLPASKLAKTYPDWQNSTPPLLSSPASSDSNHSDSSAFDLPLPEAYVLGYPYDVSYSPIFGVPVGDLTSPIPPSAMQMPYEYLNPCTPQLNNGMGTPSSADMSFLTTPTFLHADTIACSSGFSDPFPSNMYTGDTSLLDFASASHRAQDFTPTIPGDFLIPGMDTISYLCYPSPTTTNVDFINDQFMGYTVPP
ncbi:hypothetical protein BDY19DRAFT_992980 [Irpex rosettiformis]|uniref:Uncharacterized protein n=1 Tax=Irpex rosettiformis TaxID=378272 RepID=A0ACB8U6N7_9APHY|nr:hypothetical protein BDY19DRAFT_992980 [Irpex rosettiformis]